MIRARSESKRTCGPRKINPHHTWRFQHGQDTNAKHPEPVGDPNDPYGMAVLLARFLEWMRVKNYSEETVHLPSLRSQPLHRLGRRTRRGTAQRSHQADPGALPALPVSLPQAQRRPDLLPHPARQPGAACGPGSSGWPATTTSSITRPATWNCPSSGHRLPKHVLTANEAEQIIALADVNTNAWLARPCHPGDALLDGDTPHGDLQPAALRRGLRPGHDHGPSGQRAEGPHGADWRTVPWPGSNATSTRCVRSWKRATPKATRCS